MPDITQPVTITFIGATVALIFALVGVGIFLVKKYK